MNQKQMLNLLGDLWSDFRNPDFVWQVIALLLCLGLAILVARSWRRSQPQASRLHSATSRLAFPLTALVLVAICRSALKPYLHINLLNVALPLLGSMALVRGIVYVLRRSFPAATWLTTWERALALIIWSWLALYITDAAPVVIEALEQIAIPVGRQHIDLWMILHGVVTIFLTVVLALWVAGLIEARLMGLETVDTSLRIVGVRVTKALLTVIAILASLALVGIDMTALSVFSGALGVGIGLGLQKIASNYVAGFIILLDRSIRIGNVVQVDAQTTGVVSQITTRYTVLRHAGGAEFIVPNETMVGNIVQNQSYSDTRMRIATTVGVAYGTNLDLAMESMQQAASTHPRVLADPAPRVFLTAFAESSIELELGFWIADPEEGIGNVRSDINLAIWRLFRERAIEVPFPQREVRLMNPAPPPAS